MVRPTGAESHQEHAQGHLIQFMRPSGQSLGGRGGARCFTPAGEERRKVLTIDHLVEGDVGRGVESSGW